MLTAALGVQGMLWQTSPAATELEERVMLWLREMIGLPEAFTGVLQDSASSSTLCSILTAREQKTGFASNRSGLYNQKPFSIYCSTETHSSTEKAVKIAGLGNQYLRKIPVDAAFAMQPAELRKAIEEDRRQGLSPLCVVATLGTTGSTALDPLPEIGTICKEQDLWLHVDAAYAGTALLLPEMRSLLQGIESVDSFVFNPHKWMFTGLDCSAYFVRDPGALIRTLEILPEYLKTNPADRVNNYRDWGLGLGRRFRALKLWFVISAYGVTGLQRIIRDHIAWARELAEQIRREPDFELLAPMPFSTLCLRYKPQAVTDPAVLNRLNETLLTKLNAGGYLYISHTKLYGVYTLRFAIGQTLVTREDVLSSWELIKRTARTLGF
jgi:aromatic-L-amino-acid decarboxylase